MNINQRSDSELTNAANKVEAALALDTPKMKKSTVLAVLAGLGWCSPKSAGAETRFYEALRAHELPVPTNLNNLMNGATDAVAKKEVAGAKPEPKQVSSTAQTQAQSSVSVIPEQPKAGAAEITGCALVNVANVSIMTHKPGEKVRMSFIGSNVTCTSGLSIQSLLGNCNLIEFKV